jgi:hypothetical protein
LFFNNFIGLLIFVFKMQGLRALQDPKVAAALNITAEQKAKMEKVQEESGQKMREEMQKMFQGGRENFDRDAAREKMEKLRADIEKEVLGVLTSTQKKKFEEMKGEKFEIPRDQLFGGRGGPGGRGGQGRGGEGGGDRPQRKQRPGF